MTTDFSRNHGLSRRGLLRAGGAGFLVTASLAGCDALSTNPAGQGGGRSGGAKGKEAPQLADMVKKGDLPPLEERLPDKPVVVEPVERVGVYGGTWQTATIGGGDEAWFGRTIGYEFLYRFTPDCTDTIPNVAESVEQSSDAREYTIHLRKGLKWSDGEPYTADDIMFWYEDILLNDELMPVKPVFILSGDEPAKMEKVDDLTVRVVFPRPNGMFGYKLAYYEGDDLVTYPQHYMKQFHKKYNPEAEKMAKQENVPWIDFFLTKGTYYSNGDLPSFHPWNIKVPLGEGNRVMAERNPYYFKTDPDGRQLPYIDQVIYEVTEQQGKNEVILLKASNGELSFHTRHINTLPNKPVLARSREKGDYHFIDLKNAYMSDMVIALNLAHEDPVKRKIFQNKDFRIGLSYAINRQELIDAVWQRQGQPWQAAPTAQSEFYDEEFAKQYTEHDVDKANEHLDKAFPKKDSQGFRLGPDGNRITFNVEVALPALIPFWADGMDLVTGYWKEVGVNAQIRTEDRTLFYERKDIGKHDAAVWTGDGGAYDEIIEPRWYFPFSLESLYATPWAAWFMSRGADGEKPPPRTVKQMEIYWQLLEEPDPEARKDLFRQILQIAKEEFYAIGTVQVQDVYGIAKNNLHNVPSGVVPESARFACPAPSNPEQFFFE